MAATILDRTIVMLLLMLVGVICSKTGVISDSSNRDLSRFVLQVVNPVMIFMSYQTDLRPELVKNLLTAFALSVGSFAVMIVLAYLLVRDKPGRNTEIERFSAIYSNCGFMGIPLADALFGKEGVFYLTAFITVFNLIVWTHGIILISGEKSMRQVAKVFYSPTVISIVLGIICFGFQLRLPELPAKAFTFIEQLNTPMAMIVSGVTIAGTSPLRLLKKAGVYRVCAVKLIIIPAVLAVLLSLIPVDEKVRMVVIVAAAAPPAAMCTLQCLRYGRDSVYSSEIFTAGTILSAATLPLIVRLTEYLTKMIG